MSLYLFSLLFQLSFFLYFMTVYIVRSSLWIEMVRLVLFQKLKAIFCCWFLSIYFCKWLQNHYILFREDISCFLFVVENRFIGNWELVCSLLILAFFTFWLCIVWNHVFLFCLFLWKLHWFVHRFLPYFLFSERLLQESLMNMLRIMK